MFGEQGVGALGGGAAGKVAVKGDGEAVPAARSPAPTAPPVAGQGLGRGSHPRGAALGGDAQTDRSSP